MALRMYTSNEFVPNNLKIVECNDAAFLSISDLEIPDSKLGRAIIENVEGGQYKDKSYFYSKFGGEIVRSINLSTGSKTLINIINSDTSSMCISLDECGRNAIQFAIDYLDGNVVLSSNKILKLPKKSRQQYYVNDVLVDNTIEFRRMLNNVQG